MDRSNSVKAFKLLGFQVSIHVSWLVLAVLLTWTLASGYFPATLQDQPIGVYWLMGLAGAIGLFLSIILHELGHSVVARRYDIPIRGITLFIFGGVAEMEDEPPTANAELSVAAGGPVVSFLLAGSCYLAGQGGQMAGWPATVGAVVGYLAVINAIVALFNLIPAFPLDGGRMLRALLWRRKGDLRSATRTASSIGAGFGVGLIVLGGLSVLTGNLVAGIWWAVLGLFLRGAAQASSQQVEVRSALRGEQARRFMDTDPITVDPSTRVDAFVEDIVYKHHHQLFPVVESSRLMGCVGVQSVKRIPRQGWSNHEVRELMSECSGTNSVTPETDALDALSLMVRSGNSRLMVTENGRLAGVISLRNMMDFLSLKLDLDEAELGATRSATA